MDLPLIESFVIGNSGWACVCAGQVYVAAASKIAKRKARAAKENSLNLLTGLKEFGDIKGYQKFMYSTHSIHANFQSANFRAEAFLRVAQNHRLHEPNLSIVTL
jgi:hypothetical protein